MEKHPESEKGKLGVVLMVYDYACGRCKQLVEVVRHVSEIEHRAGCPDCGQAMERKIVAFRGEVGCYTVEPHYNWGLGKMIQSKYALKEHLKREAGEKGNVLYEVGSERPKKTWKRKEYTVG